MKHPRVSSLFYPLVSFCSVSGVTQIHSALDKKQESELVPEQLKANEWAVASLCVLCSLS